ncbi:DUF2459 domain-containing protein [Cellulophaga sp. HaHaR_3_176]|uniref:DUF2459 domain-containing protein n=1 Tax=Cellulophaga sp. HaHaR_3_176 TaxID=1942464 RepID=UPI0020B117FE|nr:DUF2459 domain-containing protein [Cellulophaga sp. HaHaR_3_176]
MNRKVTDVVSNKTIYLHTNGVHLDIALPKENVSTLVLADLKHSTADNYISFGWGDENFYVNTPTWGDLTFNNAFSAMFLKSTTLMHVTPYQQKSANWIEIKVSEAELQLLNTYILNTFKTDKNGAKIILKDQGYSSVDNFYKSKGSYSCLKTCNSWVNIGFKKSGLKSCLWTPFDFGLIHKYE